MPIDQRILTEFYQIGLRHGLEGRPACIATGSPIEAWVSYGAGYKSGQRQQLWQAIFGGTACLITDRKETA